MPFDKTDIMTLHDAKQPRDSCLNGSVALLMQMQYSAVAYTIPGHQAHTSQTSTQYQRLA